MTREHIDKHTETVKKAIGDASTNEPNSKDLSSLATLRARALASVDRPDWMPLPEGPCTPKA